MGDAYCKTCWWHDDDGHCTDGPVPRPVDDHYSCPRYANDRRVKERVAERRLWAPITYIEKYWRELRGHTLMLIDSCGDTCTGVFDVDVFSIYVGHYRIGANTGAGVEVDGRFSEYIAVKDYAAALPMALVAEHRGYVECYPDSRRWHYSDAPANNNHQPQETKP